MKFKARARSRGQIIVLGCVALFVMAIMLMASFGVSNAIYEKIRIQSHADAQAYSVATVEARALNLTAHYNRAIAATLVAQMSLHSWMSIATNDIAMLQAGAIIMFEIAGFETSIGCIPPYKVDHCPCVIEAFMCAMDFISKHSDWADKLEGLEDTFNQGVRALKEMADQLHESQRNILNSAMGEISESGSLLNRLRNTNAPMSEYIADLNTLNQREFACALEGSDFDDECGGPHERSKSTAEERSVTMSNVANAARVQFDKMSAMSSVMSNQNFKGMRDPDVPKDVLTSGNWMHYFNTTARTGDDHSSQASNSAQASNVGAGNVGTGVATVMSFEHSPPMSMVFTGEIYSDSNGGEHNDAHSPQHDEFKGVQQEDPCGESNCFVNFRALNDSEKDWGQPTVYGGVRQDLRFYKTKRGFGSRPAWELNSSRRVRVELVKGEPAEIDYLARNNGMGYAVSKAKVYFHQLGRWDSPPNLFDPFWRAKLHFFSKDELREVLYMSGDPNGVDLLNAGAPIEGEDR